MYFLSLEIWAKCPIALHLRMDGGISDWCWSTVGLALISHRGFLHLSYNSLMSNDICLIRNMPNCFTQ